MEMGMRRALRMTPRKMAAVLQMPCHNLAHFCCFKLRLFLMSAPRQRGPGVTNSTDWRGMCTACALPAPTAPA